MKSCVYLIVLAALLCAYCLATFSYKQQVDAKRHHHVELAEERQSGRGRHSKVGGGGRKKRFGPDGFEIEPQCGVYNTSRGTIRRKRFVAGGEETDLYMYPSLLLLRKVVNNQTKLLCAATLVHPQFAITLGLCLSNLLRDPLGPNDGLLLESTPTLEALMKTTHSFILSDTLQPACISDERVGEHENCTAVGFGNEQDFDLLQQPPKHMPVKRQKECTATASLAGLCFSVFGDRSGACYDDSGGPIYAIRDGKQTVVAVQSLILSNCHHGGSMTTVNVHSFRYFILTIIKDEEFYKADRILPLE